MGAVFVIAAVLAICTGVRYARADPPRAVEPACWTSIVVLVVMVGQFFFPALD